MQVFLVGGAVRDQLLGLPVHERDWVVVGATPGELQQQGYRPVGKDFPVFLHPQTHEEYALARTERKSGKGHRGFTFYTDPDVTLEQDLQRRDLTINAMAQSESGELVDPYHGQRDLHARQLRHVSAAFSEDPLRVFRVARFAAQLGQFHFQVAAQTLTLMREIVACGQCQHLSQERIWSETEKALHSTHPGYYFTVLDNCDALTCIGTISGHNIAQLQQTSATEPLIRWAVVTCGAQIVLTTPKVYQQYHQLISRHHHSLAQWPTLSADDKLILMEQLDYLRKPKRFTHLLISAQIIHQLQFDHNIQPLYQAIKTIDYASLARQYQGKALQQAIREARRQVILSFQMR